MSENNGVRNLTDTLEVLADFDGGVFLEKLNRALTEVAGGVIDQKVKGKVAITFNMAPVGASAQVNVTHELNYLVPTINGSVNEKDCTSTIMQVHTGGKMSIEHEDQMTMFSRKKTPSTQRNKEDQE